MRIALGILLLASCVSLVAQARPNLRRDAASIGIGYGTQGPMLTLMQTGSTLGWFTGFGMVPGRGSTNLIEPGDGTARWIRHDDGRSELHLGLAYRLDDRWVLGAGLGFAQDTYTYDYNPGANAFPVGAPPAPGPLTDDRFGLVGMVDVRLGDNWGLEMVGGVTGVGLTVTRRF